MGIGLSGKGRDKSLFLSYVFWLFGGIFGLHHFYLERDRHAFVWWSTLGGWGVGWLGDVVRIPRYVREANEDPKSVAEFIAKLQSQPKPSFSTNRFTGAVMVAFSWGHMFFSAVPTDDFAGVNWKFLYWLTPIPVALGVWTVGNIGRQRGDLKKCFLAALVCHPLRYWVMDDTTWLCIMVFASALVFDSFSKEWRRQPRKKKPIIGRLGTLAVCACLYMSLWLGVLYFNGTVTDANGDEVPIHEALHHFFTSPWWLDLKQSLWEVYEYGQQHGWYEIWKQIIDLSDPTGEQNAYKVLGLNRDSSQSEITSTWRKLSREFHPDKERDPVMRAERQNKFMEIQQAYETLSNVRSRRNRKNKKDNQDQVKVDL